MKAVTKEDIFIVFVSLIVFSSAPCTEYGFCEGDGESAESQIAFAEDAVASAYLAVLDAERAGGDISLLIFRLNHVVDVLSEAKTALTEGDRDRAVQLAAGAVENATSMEVQAHAFASSAAHDADIGFRNQVIVSVVSSGLIVGLGLFAWAYFKRYYVRQLMERKPEAAPHASR